MSGTVYAARQALLDRDVAAGAASGIPVGSPAYMSPEMVTGSPVDVRSDLYSSAAVLFELLTGQPPFVADGPLAVMRMQREAPVPDPRDLNRDLGPRMAGLLMASLAKNPAERPQSAGQMLDALEMTAAEAYGADWESRSSVRREVAGAGGATVAGGLLGLSTSVIVAGVAALLLAGGGIFALASGTFGTHHAVAVIPIPPRRPILRLRLGARSPAPCAGPIPTTAAPARKPCRSVSTTAADEKSPTGGEIRDQLPYAPA